MLKFSVITVSNILSLFLLVFSLHIHCLFYSCPTILGYSVLVVVVVFLLFFLVYVPFLVLEVFTEISSSSEILSRSCPVYSEVQSKACFIPVTVFKIWHLFWVLSYDFHLSATVAYLFLKYGILHAS